MRTSKRLLVVALAASLFAPSFASAWNNVGHMTSAILAYRRLPEGDRKAVDALLQQHPFYANMLVNDLPAGADAGEWAFAKAAAWPDDVRPPSRDYPATKPAGATDYHRSNWHYKDMPYSPDGSFQMPAEKPVPETVNPDAMPADALTALAYNRAILADASKPAADRAVALCWVEHLTGDIHQPLHGCTMYTKEYPKGDKGGNDQTVATDRGNQNLHAIWDGGLGNARGYAALDTLAKDLAGSVDASTKTKEYAEHKSAAQWLDESHALAIRYAYRDGKLQTIPTARARGAAARPAGEQMGPSNAPQAAKVAVPTLPAGYLDDVAKVSRQRVPLAAARLADTVSAALKGK